MKSIIITIATDGSASVDAQGYTGSECKDATKAIERALGVTSHDTDKPELHRASPQQQTRRQEQ